MDRTLQSIESKRSALAILNSEVKSHSGDRPLVFGEGNVNAVLAIVGEAPGRQEEEQGRPFVGKGGQLLDQMLKDVGIDREGTWVTNLVKWRPAKTNASMSTRPPSVNEIKLFTPWLWAEMRIVDPSIVLCLGRAAAQAILGRDIELEKDHGKVYELDGGTKAMATYHPAYVLRFGKEREDRGAWLLIKRDMQKLSQLLRADGG